MVRRTARGKDCDSYSRFWKRRNFKNEVRRGKRAVIYKSNLFKKTICALFILYAGVSKFERHSQL